MKRAILIAFGALAVAGQATAQEVVVFPGFVDLPIIEGGSACPEGIAAEGVLATHIDCVGVPISALNDAGWAYVRLLEERGWRFSGGASVELTVQRDRADGGCEGIDVAAVTDFAALEREDISPEEIAELPSFVFFERHDDVPCFRPSSQ